MYTIKRRFNFETREFSVMTQEEADREGIPYRHWREAEAGMYGITDDGFVMECLRRIPFGNGTILDFAGGRTMTRSKVFEFLPRYTLRDWWSFTPRGWQEKEARRGRTMDTVKLYVQMRLAGKVDWVALGKAYRPNQKVPEATVRRLFKQEIIKNMVRKEMADALAVLGISEKFVLEKILAAMNIAEKKGDSGNMLRGTETLSDMLEMKPAKQAGSFPPIPPMGELPSYEAVLKDLELPATTAEVEDEE